MMQTGKTEAAPAEAVKEGRPAGVLAEVIELLPSAAYRLRLENEECVTAHAAGATRANFLRLRPGDQVRVEISPRDKTRGRIVELAMLKKGGAK